MKPVPPMPAEEFDRAMRKFLDVKPVWKPKKSAAPAKPKKEEGKP